MNLTQMVKDLREACEDRWPTPSASDSFIWLTTEVGEFGDELMRLPGFSDIEATRNHPRPGDLERVGKEAADVLLMLISTLIHFDIDIEHVFVDRLRTLYERYRGD